MINELAQIIWILCFEKHQIKYLQQNNFYSNDQQNTLQFNKIGLLFIVLQGSNFIL